MFQIELEDGPDGSCLIFIDQQSSALQIDVVAQHRHAAGPFSLTPGGGNFVWNKDWNTFESTIYGHPGLPKKGLDTPPTLLRFKNGSFGLTFEENGLRAKVTLTR